MVTNVSTCPLSPALAASASNLHLQYLALQLPIPLQPGFFKKEWFLFSLGANNLIHMYFWYKIRIYIYINPLCNLIDCIHDIHLVDFSCYLISRIFFHKIVPQVFLQMGIRFIAAESTKKVTVSASPGAAFKFLVPIPIHSTNWFTRFLHSNDCVY